MPRRGDGRGSRDLSGSRGPAEAIVGRRPALEAIRSGSAVEVLVARSARTTEGLRAVARAAQASGVPIRRVGEEVIDDLAGGARHQGVAVRIAAPPELGEADLERRRWSEDALVLVLDGVTDPGNVGAAARAAEAAGAEGMVTRRRRGGGLTPAAMKASAGALMHLPLARVANVSRALARLRTAGFWIVGLAGEAGTSIFEAEPPPGRLALVVGSEGEGLSRLVGEACDELLAIPMRGRIGSLNVATAAAVALFALGGRTRSA